MKIIDDVVIQCTTPLFLLKTTKLLHHLQSLDYEELKSYLKCSDTIAKTTFEQFQNMILDKNYTPLPYFLIPAFNINIWLLMYLQMIK